MDRQARAWAAELDGQVVGGRYRLGKTIGVGGMGAVFDGVHQAVGRHVAVKILFPELTKNEETVRRFQQEAQAAAAIARRGVVDILDFDLDPVHGPYLVMEKLRGESLLARIRTVGRLSPSTAFSIAIQIVDTLSEVHAQGIIHRDLKPANVFLAFTEEGEEVVKLLDFGISRVAPKPGSAPLTIPGTVLGTPRFMAPEQAACDHDVDHRADLYSVGTILYYAVSGVKPYHDVPTGSLLIAVLRDGPTPLRRISPDLPEAVYEIVDQALERDRSLRFQNAAATRAALCHAREQLEPEAAKLPLTADDDFEPTAIDNRPDSTLEAAHPLAGRGSGAPNTLRERGKMRDSTGVDATDTEQTARKIPSANAKIPGSSMASSRPVPQTLDVIRPTTSSSFSQESAPPTLVSGGPALGRGSAYALRPGALDQSGAHQIAPPASGTGGARPVASAALGDNAGHPIAQPAGHPAPPQKKRSRLKLFVVILLFLVAVVVGLGGIVLGLHLWDNFGSG